jgi:amino-acid N-acetyltransferase
MEITIRAATAADYETVCTLLTANQLPVADINKTLPHFFVATADDDIVGVIGLELYGSYGLLRSMVTKERYRMHGIASKLIGELFAYASTLGIQELYLLTETAKIYFEKKLFTVVERATIPEAIRKSAEFSHVCPVTAVAMKKAV